MKLTLTNVESRNCTQFQMKRVWISQLRRVPKQKLQTFVDIVDKNGDRDLRPLSYFTTSMNY